MISTTLGRCILVFVASSAYRIMNCSIGRDSMKLRRMGCQNARSTTDSRQRYSLVVNRFKMWLGSFQGGAREMLLRGRFVMTT